MVLDHGLIPPLIRVLTTGDFKTKKEAAWAVSNLTVGGSAAQVCVHLVNGVMALASFLIQISVMVHHGAIGPMCNLLDCQDSTVIQVRLHTFFIVNVISDIIKTTSILFGRT